MLARSASARSLVPVRQLPTAAAPVALDAEASPRLAYIAVPWRPRRDSPPSPGPVPAPAVGYALSLKNKWIAFSFWLCGAHQRDKVVISVLLLVFLGLVSLLVASSRSLSVHNRSRLTFNSNDSTIEYLYLSLDTGFPVMPTYRPQGLTFSPLWQEDRRYGIVIDAGSSGTRLMIYSWKVFEHPSHDHHNLPVIEKAVHTGSSEPWSKSVEPGLSSLSSLHINEHSIASYLEPLLTFASDNIPQSLHKSTPIYLLATAGMRLVPLETRRSILKLACTTTQERFNFEIRNCEIQFRVISGELEGIFGWVAMNYLNAGFSDPARQSPPPLAGSPNTFGFMDMGGASTQIAFEPVEEMKSLHEDDLTQVMLRKLDGTHLTFKIFVSTFLGFGVNEARKRYLENFLDDNAKTVERNRKDDERIETAIETESSRMMEQISTIIHDPCLPTNLSLETSVFRSSSATLTPISLLGTGSLLDCIANLEPLLRKHIACPDEPCLFNGVHAPIANFSRHRFMGISEYYYTPKAATANMNADTSALYSYADFVKGSDNICRGPYNDLLRDQVKLHGKKLTSLEESRLQLQCFKSSWGEFIVFLFFANQLISST
ncbi:Golgi apyrase [Entophlyctis luteolus]|nr:Golgi apyrase [Entophlyctis luteolus]